MSLAAASLDPLHVVLLLLIGLAAGVLGGLLGVGGGLVMIPAMAVLLGKLYGPGSLHLYQLAALSIAFLLSIPAARQHLRARAVVKRFLASVIAFGVGGVLLGVVLGSGLAGEQTHVLQRIFGGFLILLVGASIWEARGSDASKVASCPTPARWLFVGAWVGLPAGLLAGLLGVGGGIWAVPVQHRGLGIRLQSAIATSACMIVGLAAAATISKGVAVARMADLKLGPAWVLAACLAPGAIAGASFGARLTHILPLKWLRLAFHILLAATGVRLVAAA